MATEETNQSTASNPAPEATAPAATEAPAKPVLDDKQKFQTRDFQLKQQTSQIQFQTAANNARQADQNFRNHIATLANDLKVDVNAWQLNLDTLEFEPRVAQPAPNAKPAA